MLMSAVPTPRVDVFTFSFASFRLFLFSQGVQNPVHVVGDSRVDSGEALGAALFQSIADHAVLDDARIVLVCTKRLQGTTTVAHAGVRLVRSAGAHLLVPDLRGVLVYLLAFLVVYRR